MPRPLIFIALLGFGLVSVQALAQDAPATPPAGARAEKDPQRQVRHLSRLLDLSPQQAAALAPVIEQRQQQLSRLRQNTSLDRRVRRDRLRSIQRDTDAQIQSVLTDSQKQKYAQWKQQLQERRQQKQRGSGTADGE
ncbi:hypothetical protein ATSB10_29230 [Dyella thiooxydans]|uniref:LTXXQ motif family protein n=1 Tax=Dyella thiooxydans TaxID=445710 RepID=A0A160N3Q0_9GAMM|nr:hypothetical protein [Dyella thiooxydans]AND70377.1 hypothetical protein ATSB10_29230 [Dyella thiooxydans]